LYRNIFRLNLTIFLQITVRMNSFAKDIVKMKIFFYSLTLLIFFSAQGFSQSQDSKAITYKTIFDDPNDLYKLWIGLQPLYTDLFVSNLNIGFGAQAHYYHGTLFDCKIQARKAYGEFSDQYRNLSNKSDSKNVGGSSTSIKYEPTVFNYFEVGGTYHVVDKVQQGKAKIILYSKRYKDWSSTVPQYIWVPAQVRLIYGARLGGIWFDTTTDLQRALQKQNTSISNREGTQTIDGNSGNLFGNVHTRALYIGGSATRIKNIAIKPDKGYGVLLNDIILTAYFDLIIAPSVKVDDVILGNDLGDTRYLTESIKTRMIGGRVGIDGLFNREFSWSYGAEIGFRPSVASGGFYTLIKLGFPVFGTKLSQQKEAFGK